MNSQGLIGQETLWKENLPMVVPLASL